MGAASAKVNFGRALLTFSVLAIYQTVLTDITCKPLDSESRVNELTYFNCSSSITTEEIHWYHYPVGAEVHERKSVYAYGKFYKDYMEDFEVEKNSSGGAYNLVIRSVKLSYAGRYECEDNRGQRNSCSAELIVLDDDPHCFSDINPAGVIGPNGCGIPPEDLHLSCNVTYHGNIPPKLKWSRVGENESISKNVMTEPSVNRITYNVTLIANVLLDNSLFECQTTNSRTSKHSCTSEILKILYVNGTSSVSEKIITEVINCSANTNSQFCEYRWKWYGKEDSLTVSNNGTLTIQKTGQHRCEATCNLRNMSCMVNASLINARNVSNTDSDSTGSSSTGVVVGVVLALLVILIFVILLVLFYFRRRRSHQLKEEEKVEDGAKGVTENYTQEAHPLLETSQVEEEEKPEKNIPSEDWNICSHMMATRRELPCKHVICLDCIKEIIEKAGRRNHLLCPNCTGLFTITAAPKDSIDPPQYIREMYKPEIKEAPGAGVIEHNEKIMGMTVLGDELFVVCKNPSNVIFKYDIGSKNQAPGAPEELSISEMKWPRGIAACETSGCLYITDWHTTFGGRLWRYMWQKGEETKEELDVQPFGVSVSQESQQVLVTCATPVNFFVKRGWIYIYKPSGSDLPRIRTVELPDLEIPRHSILTPSSKFIVCHGWNAKIHGVTSYLDDETPQIRKKSFYGTVSGGGSGEQEMNGPLSMTQDEDGLILVVDYYNHRIQLLTEDLHLVRHLISSGITYPRHVCQHPKTGRMYVGKEDGKVQIFDARNVSE